MKITRATHETVEANCENCGGRNVYNRLDDLKTIQPICGRSVPCEHCGQAFWISGDWVNESYDKILEQAAVKLREKQHADAITGAAQAVEHFLPCAMQAVLVLEPWARGEITDPQVANELIRELDTAIARYPFKRLRLAAIYAFLEAPFHSSAEVRVFLARLDSMVGGKFPKQKLAALPNVKLREGLEELRTTRVHEKWNPIRHRAHRTLGTFAKDRLEEAGRLISGIKAGAGLQPAIMYWNKQVKY
ncbi:MAG: hypothetical protein HZB25_10460 [Candidatus Eisenbacteria bacterium]|nr:hypothetical protein [Candidatus Eisenbacteria bacterium]